MIQSPFKFAALCMLVGSVIPLVSSVTVQNADTPTFYLVSSSGTPSTNLLVRVSLYNITPDIYWDIVPVACTINRGCW